MQPQGKLASIFTFAQRYLIKRNTLCTLMCLWVLSACQWNIKDTWDEQYGNATPISRYSTEANVELYEQAHGILERRCVVCHACYDAPCQLKLSSMEGLNRGANKQGVYEQRFIASSPSRLYEDGSTVDQWRDKKFFPVLNERLQTPEANKQLSLLWRLLEQKKQHPLPANTPLPESIDTSISRKHYCPKIEEYDDFAKDNPLFGMPFGMSAISESEYSILSQWIEQGAIAPQPKALDKTTLAKLEKWEAFFNQESLQAKLVNRYIYEHLYLANLYFEDKGVNTQFYKLVRSFTPSGEPIRVIPSRRPFDTPYISEGMTQFYYRLRPVHQSIVLKTHMPYVLNEKRMDFWQEIFFSEDFKVKKLPSYKTEVSANPFKAFSGIPIYNRYKFLLEEAQFTIMNFIKGPVCRGQVALDVINDQFWVAFTNPELHKSHHYDQFLKEHADLLRFPAHYGSQGSLFSWPTLASRSKEYAEARAAYLKSVTERYKALQQEKPQQKPVESPPLIWDGNQHQNDNAALSIFRHFDSATVIKGFAGTQPKTAWLISYDLLERIHYLLVAGFDVNGTVQHQLTTRLYMNFLRMEGEANFISLLPEPAQMPTAMRWNKDVGDSVKDHFKVLLDNGQFELPLTFQGKNSEEQQTELFSYLNQVTNANNYTLDKNLHFSKNTIEQLKQLNQLQGKNVSYLPEASFIQIREGEHTKWFTLLRHSAHKNLSHLLSEDNTRVPKNDRLNIIPGFISAYPNRFLQIKADHLDSFIQDISQASNQAEADAIINIYAISRTHPDVWRFADQLHSDFANEAGLTFGLFDFNRLSRQ